MPCQAYLDPWQLPFAHWKRSLGTRNIQKAKETARRHRQRSVCRHAMPELQSVAESAWQGYESLLDSQGLATDVATAAVLNSASDVVAQLSEMQREDGRVIRAERALRYAAFGSMDGCAGHYWFTFLDTMLPRSGDDVLDTVAKVLADSAVYTPCWCVAFLLVMAVLEGRGPQAGVLEVRRDFWSLLKGNYGITLPFVALIYGLAPVRYQVACFAALTLAYTIVLGLEVGGREKGASKQRQRVSQQCECKLFPYPLSLVLQVLSLWASARDPTVAIPAQNGQKRAALVRHDSQTLVLSCNH
ncbi:Pxmp2 [Symbiodinium sp. CCMP2592]|nr:Pxmp2 [Symbiodinium sp. CCMP2592]